MKNSLLVVPARFGEPDLLALISPEAKIGEGASERGQSANSADPPHQPTSQPTHLGYILILLCLASDAAIHPASIPPPNVIPGRGRGKSNLFFPLLLDAPPPLLPCSLASSLCSCSHGCAGGRVSVSRGRLSSPPPPHILSWPSGRRSLPNKFAAAEESGGNEVLLRPARPGTNLRLFRVARHTLSALLRWEECPSINGV